MLIRLSTESERLIEQRQGALDDARQASEAKVMLADVEPIHSFPTAFLATCDIVSGFDQRFLTSEEHALFSTLDGSSRRRKEEWIAGRRAAHLALTQMGVNNCSVLKADNGAPILKGPDADKAQVTISHGKYCAVAMAQSTRSQWKHVGIDLVDASDLKRIQRISKRVLTPNEQKLCAENPMRYLIAWGVREAIAKATRTGMFVYALSAIEVLEIKEDSGEIITSHPHTHSIFRVQTDESILVLVAATDEAVSLAKSRVSSSKQTKLFTNEQETVQCPQNNASI